MIVPRRARVEALQALRRSVGTVAAACALALCACASVNPTLVSARVLPAGHASLDVGSAYDAPLVAGGLPEARNAAVRIQAGNDTQADRDAVVREAAAMGTTPGGVSSYVAARVGFAHETEAQLSWMGRTARLGARHVVWHDTTGEWSMSVGAQARFAFLAIGLDGTLPGLSVSSAFLYGGDAVVLLGKSNSDLYDVLIGLRVGYTHGDGSMRFNAPATVNGGALFGTTLDRVDGALTLGLRVGFGHVSAMAEIEADVGYFTASTSAIDTGGGTVRPLSISGGIFAIVPAASLSYAF